MAREDSSGHILRCYKQEGCARTGRFFPSREPAVRPDPKGNQMGDGFSKSVRAGVGHPYEASRIKRSAAALWRTVKRDIEAGIPPSADLSEALIEALEGYEHFVEDTWRGQWDECRRLLDCALAAAVRGDLARAVEEADRVDGFIISCHRSYR